MWDTPIYTFEKEVREKGKTVKKPFHINVTYSAPRNLDEPGTALVGVFKKITQGMKPESTHILDIGAAKLRNTLWLLEKGFHVWAVEFPELRERLPDAKKKWDYAEKKHKNFHKVTFPKDFLTLDKQFDIILLINEINVMPIPRERFMLLHLCRQKIKAKGMLLWHQWRGLSVGGDRYSEENAFIDGYLMGTGPNHSFYVEHTREECHEMLYSVGFEFDKDMNLHKIPSNSCYSYIFRPKHQCLIEGAIEPNKMMQQKLDPKRAIGHVDSETTLSIYLKQLKLVSTGRDSAHQFHLLASRIFFEIFRNQLGEPVIEREINEGRGRIDFCCSNRNKEGIFKNLKEMRDIKCPDIFVECKNYENNLTNEEYSQLGDRLIPDRSMLGILICRSKKNQVTVLKHCQDRKKGGKYIIVLDDKDLVELANYKMNDEDDSRINKFIDNKIKEIID